MTFALVLSLAIGLALGVLGGGGSIITVPILVYVLGLQAEPAIATSLLVVGLSSAAAMLTNARRVSFKVGLTFGASSMVGAFGGGKLAHLMPPKMLLMVFASMMIVTGLAMMRARRVPPLAERRWGRIVALGVGIGAVTGLVGAGGGFIIVPALVLICGMPMPSAVATSLFVISMNSLSGLAGHLGHVALDLGVAAPMTGVAMVGGVAGALIGRGVRPEELRRAFGWLVLAVAVFMIGRETSPALAAFVVAALIVHRTLQRLHDRNAKAPSAL